MTKKSYFEVVKLLHANGRRADQAVKGKVKEEKEKGGLTKAVRVCENCGKEAAKMQKCSRCRLVRYCSQDCQLGDWEDHKKSCKKVDARKKGGKGGE